ncbi:hypothetical protein FA15DRAFT_317378 [Coprinopsis marcescibilis]|uniref:Uncharacterized protein n=1 Tax=Coprinopsis marcescibilis TaxID=230819 RepID=A0A5C3KCD8_COPMA|nr:hypothetical protein FA15DRAFT_317378 [Coprinopsis marcescibilis]
MGIHDTHWTLLNSPHTLVFNTHGIPSIGGVNPTCNQMILHVVLQCYSSNFLWSMVLFVTMLEVLLMSMN